MRKPPGSERAARNRTTAAARRELAEVRRRRVLEESRSRREAGFERRRGHLARARRQREASLVDLLDRLLDGGVVVHGDITLAVADVDLVYVGLRALIASVESVQPRLGSALPAGDR